MHFAYPSQRIQDWLSQQWCILTGRKVDPVDIAWLMGPYGNVDVIEERYVDVLADTAESALNETHRRT